MCQNQDDLISAKTSVQFLRISKFNITPVNKETGNSWTGCTRIFSRLRETITFLLLLHSVLLKTDSVDINKPSYIIVRVLYDDEKRLKVVSGATYWCQRGWNRQGYPWMTPFRSTAFRSQTTVPRSRCCRGTDGSEPLHSGEGVRFESLWIGD